MTSFTEPYYRSRRNYAFFSSLLLFWEFVDLRIEDISVVGLDIFVGEPQAIPIVLLLIVIYQSVRISIEWYQCDASLRKTAIANLDFYLAHALGTISLAVYLSQSAFNLSIVDTASEQDLIRYIVGPIVIGPIIGLSATNVVRSLIYKNQLTSYRALLKKEHFWRSSMMLLATTIVSLAYLFVGPRTWQIYTLSVVFIITGVFFELKFQLIFRALDRLESKSSL